MFLTPDIKMLFSFLICSETCGLWVTTEWATITIKAQFQSSTEVSGHSRSVWTLIQLAHWPSAGPRAWQRAGHREGRRKYPQREVCRGQLGIGAPEHLTLIFTKLPTSSTETQSYCPASKKVRSPALCPQQL